MTRCQIRMVLALSKCRMAAMTKEKRFIRDMRFRLCQDPMRDLTDRQSDFLRHIWFRYREQLWKNGDWLLFIPGGKVATG